MKAPKPKELDRYNKHFYYWTNTKKDNEAFGMWEQGRYVLFDYENDCMKIINGSYLSEDRDVIKELKGIKL